jgi:hypothetical protein
MITSVYDHVQSVVLLINYWVLFVGKRLIFLPEQKCFQRRYVLLHADP